MLGNTTLYRIALPAIAALLSFAANAADAIYLSGDASAAERAAASELQRLWFLATDEQIPIRDTTEIADGATGWLLGTPSTTSEIEDGWPFADAPPLYDGYIVARSPRYPDLWIVAAEKPMGLVNGVFGALESLGFRFGFGLEVVPDNATLSALARFAGTHSPRFAVRGLMPRFGSLVGASTWDWPDYRAYIDDARRMGINAIAFYTSDFDPFTAYEFAGDLVGGERLPNTARPMANDVTVPSQAFLEGTGALFADDYFGAASSFIDERDISIRASQDVLARAVQYAKARGMFVGIGFEAVGDPTQPETQAHLAARVQSILDLYPAVDSIWIWEPRSEAALPTQSPAQRSVWESFRARWDDAFGNVPDVDRRAEAARMSLYAQYTRQLVYVTRPDITVIVSGWRGPMAGGFEDYYLGLDAVLPHDIVIAGLDPGDFDTGAASEVGAVDPNRMRIPILSLEKREGLLGPQPVLERLDATLDDASPQGNLAIYSAHWRTKDANETAMFFARHAWRDQYSMAEYLADRAATEFGGGAEIAELLAALQGLGPGWTGASLRPTALGAKWQPGIETRHDTLLRIGYDARGLLNGSEGLEQSALERLADEIDLALRLDEGIRQLANLSDSEPPRTGLHPWLGQTELPEAAQSLARHVTNKDDLGAIALFNVSVWETLLRVWPDEEPKEPPRGFLQRRPQLPEQIVVLPGRVIVLSNHADRMDVRVEARALGGEEIFTQPLRDIGDNTYALDFPGDLAGVANVEFGVVAQLGARKRLVWPPGYPDQWHAVTRHAEPAPEEAEHLTPAPGAPFEFDTRIRPDRYSVELSWRTRRGELYTVYRDGEELGTVPGGWFEDTRPTANRTVTYTVEARQGLTGSSVKRDVRVRTPDLPLPEPPSIVRATARANRIVLGWQSDSPQAAQYQVLKYDRTGEMIEETIVAADYGQYLQISDQVSGGQRYRYTVAGVAPDGRVGPPSDDVRIVSSREPLRPVLQLSFTDDRYLEGLADLAENGLALGGAGWAELPPQPNWDPTHALTLSVWVKLDDIDGMPVLITKGTWLQSGYFLQIVQGRVRFSMAGIDTLDAGMIDAGQWHLITATYGFGQMRIYIDGEQAGRKNVSGRPRAGGESLLVGRYVADEDAYFLRGLMDDIRMYDVPLTANEVRELYEETFRE
jgi:hypothetical protein